MAVIVFVLCMAVIHTHTEPYTPVSAIDSENKTVMLPVIMYHSVLKDKSMHGEYVVSPDEVERDLKYICDNDYTCITPGDLCEYINGRFDMPKKPVMLTFDDGYYNNYLYLYPLLKKYNCKATIAVIGTYTQQYTDNPDENAYYSHCTWDNLREMLDSGLIEVANHSYNMHKSGGERLGTRKNHGESSETYKNALKEDIIKLQEAFKEKLNTDCETFVYPFGAYTEEEDDFIKSLGFKCTITCSETVNYITKDPGSLFKLGRFLRPSGLSLEDIFRKNNLC